MKRYPVLDNIRGITLISMILYHGMWDLVFLFQKDVAWYRGEIGYLWQQSICWTFILLSGFCWSLGRKKGRRGLIVFGAGAALSLVTVLVMPDNRVIFGILTFLGSSMLLMVPLNKWLKQCRPETGLVCSMVCFTIFRNINRGGLGFESFQLTDLPEKLYRNMLTAYVGFPPKHFFSTDYFAVFPWFFLFMAGYFLYRTMESRGWMHCLESGNLPAAGWIGRHSLIIYLLHQPVLFLVMQLLMCVMA